MKTSSNRKQFSNYFFFILSQLFRFYFVIATFFILFSLILLFNSNEIIRLLQTLEFFSEYNPKTLNTVIKTIGATILSTGAISTVFDFIQRSRYVTTITNLIDKIIEDKLPNDLKNIVDSGIENSYKNLNVERLIQRIQKVQGRRIKILKIWIPNLKKFYPFFYEAIVNRGCELDILLLDPTQEETIKARSESLGKLTTEADIKSNIEENIRLLKELKSDLDEVKKGDKLTLKTHKSFVATSIIGFGDLYWIGLYLKNRLANDGMIIKLEGSHRTHFRDIDNHFKSEWETSQVYPGFEKKKKCSFFSTLK